MELLSLIVFGIISAVGFGTFFFVIGKQIGNIEERLEDLEELQGLEEEDF